VHVPRPVRLVLQAVAITIGVALLVYAVLIIAWAVAGP
jgi:hypothetical protein